jgi:DNA-binding NarL/FixJ family response regulator
MRRSSLVLAEDHPAVAKYLRELLADHFEVLGVVADGEALITLVNESRPDAVVSDIGLQGTNGFAATKTLRQSYAKLPIVLISILDFPSLREEAVAAGASAFLPKTEAPGLVALLLQLTHGGTPT